MDRLHEDIDARAEKFGYVEYYDASLRDKKARDTAVAADNVNLLDDRRKPLAEVNPLLAQNSELPPEPSIEKEAYEYAGINLNAVAKEALNELDAVEHTPVSHATKKSSEPQSEPEFVTVDSVKSAIAELKELDVNNEYGIDDLSAMLDSVQEQIQAATSEEEMNAAFAQLHDLKEAADSIKAQLAVSEDSEVVEDVEEEEVVETKEPESDDKSISFDEIEELVESLIEKDTDNQYGVQDLAATLMTLKEQLENPEGDERNDTEKQLTDLYDAALAIEAELNKQDGE